MDAPAATVRVVVTSGGSTILDLKPNILLLSIGLPLLFYLVLILSLVY